MLLQSSDKTRHNSVSFSMQHILDMANAWPPNQQHMLLTDWCGGAGGTSTLRAIVINKNVVCGLDWNGMEFMLETTNYAIETHCILLLQFFLVVSTIFATNI